MTKEDGEGVKGRVREGKHLPSEYGVPTQHTTPNNKAYSYIRPRTTYHYISCNIQPTLHTRLHSILLHEPSEPATITSPW